jgi:PAS domain-containing protein
MKSTLPYNEANHLAFEDLFEHALIGLHIVGSDGIVNRANRADRAPVGLADRPHDYAGHHIGEFHAEDPVVEEILEHLLNNRSLMNYPADLKTINGDRAPVSIYSNSKMDGDEFLNTRCFTKVGTAELKSFANELLQKQVPARDLIAGLSAAEKQSRFDALHDFFENGLVPVRIINAEGRIQWANSAELSAMGYAGLSDEYIGQPAAKFHADQAAADRVLFQLRSNVPLTDFEAQLVRRDGSLFPVYICSNSRTENNAFINSRCFTYSVAEMTKEQPQRFSWPRNEKMFE